MPRKFAFSWGMKSEDVGEDLFLEGLPGKTFCLGSLLMLGTAAKPKELKAWNSGLPVGGRFHL